jgi:hypothetical protein
VTLAGLVLGLLAGGGAGPAAPLSQEAGGHLTVYLATFGPGPRIWERFGHNAILFRDTLTGASRAYDYGRFSFETAGFLREFAMGRMHYWMGVEDGDALLAAYARRGRAVWLQELRLEPAQRLSLLELLEADWALEQGRYRYDYYEDNCSTRVRDAIDAVIGGVIRATLAPVPSGTSWRWHTRRSLENNVFQYFAVDASLGPDADRGVSRYEETFLPLKLREYLREVTVPGPDGEAAPLVRGERTVAESDAFAVPERPANRVPGHLAAGVLVGALLAWLGWKGTGAAWARRGFVTLAALWALGAGLGGAVLAFFWGLSEHVIAHRNANVFQFNLLALVLFVLLALAVRGGAGRIRRAWIAALGLAGLGVAGLVWSELGGTDQATGVVVAFALPVHLGVAAGLSRLAAAPVPSAAPPGPR